MGARKAEAPRLPSATAPGVKPQKDPSPASLCTIAAADAKSPTTAARNARESTGSRAATSKTAWRWKTAQSVGRRHSSSSGKEEEITNGGKQQQQRGRSGGRGGGWRRGVRDVPGQPRLRQSAEAAVQARLPRCLRGDAAEVRHPAGLPAVPRGSAANFTKRSSLFTSTPTRKMRKAPPAAPQHKYWFRTANFL